MHKTVGKGTEHGCFLLSEAEGCSCYFLRIVGAKLPQTLLLFMLGAEKPCRAVKSGVEEGENPWYWMYVVCHPCLVAQEDALPGIIPLLFPSRRPLPSRWSVTEELYFVLSLSCGAKGSYFGGHLSTSSIYGCQKAQIAHTNCLQTPPARAQVVVP